MGVNMVRVKVLKDHVKLGNRIYSPGDTVEVPGDLAAKLARRGAVEITGGEPIVRQISRNTALNTARAGAERAVARGSAEAPKPSTVPGPGSAKSK
jgi:hypothetical protein